MNCYDFDKTIYKKDSAISLLFYAIKRKPVLIFNFVWIILLTILNKLRIISTKHFKEKYYKFLNKFNNKEKFIEEFWDHEQKNINNWYLKQMREDDVVCSASPEFIIKPIMAKINPKSIVFGTDMDINTLEIHGENLKGEQKRLILEEKGFDKFEKVYTDSLSDFPLYDMADEKYFVSKSKVYVFGKQKLGLLQKLKYIIKQMRIKHYVKNGLIFVPLIFSGLLTQGPKLTYLVTSVWGFIAFCLAASFVYVVNDLFDAKKDRNHTKKRKRPIAAYMIKSWEAVLMLICISASISLIWIYFLNLNLWALIIIVLYIIINLLYSFSLKKVPIVDVFILALCYVIRVYFGASIIGVGVSKWLYLTIICASLYMGYGKRRGEIKCEDGKDTRGVMQKYTFNFLDKNIYMCLTMCLVFYSLWAVDFKVNTVGYFNSILVLITIPLVIFILMRYSLDIEKGGSGDPIDVLLKDYILLASALLFVIIIAIAVYVPVPMKL